MADNKGFKALHLLRYRFRAGDEQNFNNLIFADGDRHSPPLIMAHFNLHALYLANKDAEFDRYLQSVEYAWIDGYPIVWILNLLGQRVPRSWRTTFLDWQDSFFQRANDEHKCIFLLGSNKAVIAAAHKVLDEKFPQIKFHFHHGYLDDPQDPASSSSNVVNVINEVRPDVLLVGMGMPLQEKWIQRHRNSLDSRVIMPVGGYFDYLGGLVPTPNRLISSFGLEWLLRLVNEPRRLAFRYLVEPWVVAWSLLRFHLLKMQ